MKHILISILLCLGVFFSPAFAQAVTQYSLEQQLSPEPIEMVPQGSHYAIGNFDRDSKLEIFVFSHPREYLDTLALKSSHDRRKRWNENKHWVDSMRVFEVWDDNWASEDRKISVRNPENFCLHASSPGVADFNSDGIDDVFISCHGFDSDPFPGEHSYVILSVADSSEDKSEFVIKRVTERKSFAHNSTIMDVNNDGHLDVLLIETNGKRTKVVYHAGNSRGNFSQERTIWQTKHGGYIIEAIDIDKDGFAELIVGGTEHDNFATRILWNNGDGKFKKSTVLPKVKGTGPHDFFLEKDMLYVMRVNKGWVGVKLQQIDINTYKTVTIIENNGPQPGKLQRFIKDGEVSYRDIGTNITTGDFRIVNNRPEWLEAQ